MTDIAMIWNGFGADLELEALGLKTDDGLKTAVTLSLFSDRRADAQDVLPEAGADPRGWWGDLAAGVPNDRLGSKLWLLSREKQTAATLQRARDYAQEALDWLVDDGVASAVAVEAEVIKTGVIGLRVIIERPTGPARQTFDFVWKAL